MDCIFTASINSITSPWGKYSGLFFFFITFRTESWHRNHYCSALDSFSQFIPWWIVPEQTGWLGGLHSEHCRQEVYAPLLVTHQLSNHIGSEQSELFNILQLPFATKRMLTPVLDPWFTITMPWTCGRATQDRHCPSGMSLGRPHFAQLCGTLKWPCKPKSLRVILIIKVKN